MLCCGSNRFRIGLSRSLAVNLVLLGVRLDISDGERQRVWIAGTEQYAVDSGGDEFGEGPVACRDWRDARGHGLHGDKAKRFLPGGWQQDRASTRNEFRALVAAESSLHFNRWPGRGPLRYLVSERPPASDGELKPRLTGLPR